MTYALLKDSLKKSIEKYLVEAKVKEVDDLPKHRRAHVKVLNLVMDLLETSFPANEEKVRLVKQERVLKGFVLIVSSLIPDSRLSKGSRLKKNLLDILNTSDCEKKDLREKGRWIQGAILFYNSLAFAHKGKGERIVNSFSSIEGFTDLNFEMGMVDLENANKKLFYSLSAKEIDFASEENKSKPSSSSFFSLPSFLKSSSAIETPLAKDTSLESNFVTL